MATTRATSSEAKIEALRWELAQRHTSAKNWLELVRLLQTSRSAEEGVDHGAAAVANAVNEVYERALRALPYSYKLWLRYVQFRVEHTALLCRSVHEWFASVRDLYERALQKLPHMPLLWLSYLDFVTSFAVLRVTMVRHIVAAALLALPATQHHLIWRRAKAWTRRKSTPHVTAQALWRAYLCFDTSMHAQREYLLLLLERGDMDGFMHHCVCLCSAHTMASPDCANRDSHTASAVPPAHTQLLEDVALWDLVMLAFRTPGWMYSGSLDELHSLAQCGERHAASASDFMLAYALFVCGQGEVIGGRRILYRLLRDAPDPATFTRVFATAVQVEDAVLQAFALHARLRSSSSSSSSNADVSDAAALRHDVTLRLFDDLVSKEAHTLPLIPLRRLLDEHALWLNESQLRCQPRNVALWLKRVELTLARVHSGALSPSDVHALHQQAIAQCTAGLRRVPAAVAELYDSAVRALLQHGMSQHSDVRCSSSSNNAGGDSRSDNDTVPTDSCSMRAVVTLLLDGAWRTPFVSSAVNARLLGLLVEVRLLTAPRQPIASAVLHDTLLPYLIGTAVPRTVGRRRPHSDHHYPVIGSGSGSSNNRSSLLMLTVARDALAGIKEDARAWLLAWDMCMSFTGSSDDGSDDDALTNVWLNAYTTQRSGGSEEYVCSAEGLCYVAHALYTSGATAAAAGSPRAAARAHEYACRVMDCALARSAGDAVARVFVIGQYIALLCNVYGTATPMLRVRELMQHARDVATTALTHAAHATAELFVSAALLECRIGLYSEAVLTVQHITLVAVETLSHRLRRTDTCSSGSSDVGDSRAMTPAATLALLAGLCEVSIDLVLRCSGIVAVRAYASALLGTVAASISADAVLLQRVALHWAALEKRSGYVKRAHAVLDACAESQNPHSVHGRAFWQLWQSLCSNVEEYTMVVQRRQHAEVHFRKQP